MIHLSSSLDSELGTDDDADAGGQRSFRSVGKTNLGASKAPSNDLEAPAAWLSASKHHHDEPHTPVLRHH